LPLVNYDAAVRTSTPSTLAANLPAVRLPQCAIERNEHIIILLLALVVLVILK
jgi:hypothetical protein